MSNYAVENFLIQSCLVTGKTFSALINDVLQIFHCMQPTERVGKNISNAY